MVVGVILLGSAGFCVTVTMADALEECYCPRPLLAHNEGVDHVFPSVRARHRKRDLGALSQNTTVQAMPSA